jgi:beta-aspartyl-peptidase (threonine type)
LAEILNAGEMMKPFILVNGEVRDGCIAEGIAALRQGASALDAAELVARAVESDVNDHSVGFSGLPNILGEVELDASIMDGATLASGAVAALKGYPHPISVARQVMERLPHVLLAGEGAAQFAQEVGAEAKDLLTPEAKAIYLKRLKGVLGDLGIEIGDSGLEMRSGRSQTSNLQSQSTNLKSQISQSGISLSELVGRALKYHEGGDTMNVVVRDASGHIVSAVTTSGVAWKYPGRVGDSPIVGAGNYVDDRYGAATCTGVGELTIRHGTAVRAVALLQAGQGLAQVGRAIMRDLLPLSKPQNAWIRLLLMDRAGNVGGFCTHANAVYKVQAIDEDAPRVETSELVQ